VQLVQIRLLQQEYMHLVVEYYQVVKKNQVAKTYQLDSMQILGLDQDQSLK
tara:strand:+ start:245 stop:397 length:153 start_codon:yes stop_codon:yes gene_type:complete